ncbi:hypothetical protein FB565_003448 [Actinoplanes lutulentus]|nr:hypothetical protein [Actinoplanes lutulentus]
MTWPISGQRRDPGIDGTEQDGTAGTNEED